TDPATAYPIYHFDQTSNIDILTSDNRDNCHDFYSYGTLTHGCQEDNLSGAINAYLNDGFQIVAVGDAYLGPGLRCGPDYFSFGDPIGIGSRQCRPNLSRGGTFIAYKPDFSEVAHVTIAANRFSKGGAAANTAPQELQLLDIPTPADLLKEEEEDAFAHSVDLRSGRLTLNTGSLLETGTSGFPYSLSFSRSLQTGEKSISDPTWEHNWNMPLSISGSGNEMLGASRGIFASHSIGVISVLLNIYDEPTTSPQNIIQQETIGALIASWWTEGLVHNVVSAGVNGQNIQFVRKLDTNEFWPVTGGATRVYQSGDRYIGWSFYDETTNSRHVTTLAWRSQNLSFKLKNPSGDEIHYDFWRPFYTDVGEQFNTDQTDGNRHLTHAKPGFRASKWTFLSDIEVTFTYDINSQSTCFSIETCKKPILVSVENNLGRKLTFTGSYDNPESVTDDSQRSISLTDNSITHVDGKTTTYDISESFLSKRLSNISDPGFATPNHNFSYDVDGKIASYENAHGNQWLYRIGGGRRGATVDPFGNASVEYFDEDGNSVRMVSRVGDITDAQYDGLNRLTARTLPEGNKLFAFYDANSNVTRVDQLSKDGSEALTTSAVYHPVWQKPVQSTDANGNVTDITYFETGKKAGMLHFVDQPADDDGARPRTT
ncbi:MAG: hypothetical protein AAFY91_15090, partial [Bacteroidota bacterium]